MVQLTKALALEWAEHGIRVNALAPGYFETDINRDLLRSPAGQALIARVPQKRVGQLADLDGPLLLLASDASAYMTGAVIPVDGGHLVSSLWGGAAPGAGDAGVESQDQAFPRAASP